MSAAAGPIRLAVYGLFGSIWLGLLGYGLPYYRLGLAERVRSPQHALLRPNGDVGLLYAYAGSTVLLLLFLYSIRKRVRLLHRLGSLRPWLNVHIFFGISGPALITLHSSFKISGAIAIGYWAMIGVALSGFVGYYLLRQVGGALSETEQDAHSMAAELSALDVELTERFRLSQADLESLRRHAGADRAAEMGLLQSLVYLVLQDLRGVFETLRLVPSPAPARRMGRAEARRFRALARQRVVIERRRAFLRSTSALFHYWHTIHRPFTFVLFLMMAVHIGIAVWLGYAVPQR